MERVNLKDYDEAGLRELIAPYGKERFRATQILRWLYRQRTVDIDEMTNLGKDLRAWLSERTYISEPRVADLQRSVDGTRKLALELEDGRRVETVMIPDDGRLTLCISSQVGCGFGCDFCRTAKMGLKRNLRLGEIMDQIRASEQNLEEGERITNIVFMGMGEPMHNLDAVLPAIRLLTDDNTYQLASKAVTVSTVGHVPGIRRFAAEYGGVGRLAVSLNATTDEVRDVLMPVNKRYNIETLMAALKQVPLPPKKKITFEYILLDGVNDSDEDARRLVRLLSHIPSKVNLISFNPWPGVAYRPSPEERQKRFQAILGEKNLLSRLRKSRGPDILGACGQLATEVRSA